MPSRLRAAMSAPLVFSSIALGASPPVASTFEGGVEGWTIKDLNCNNYAQVVGGGTVSHLAKGGDPLGLIRSTDPSGNCYTFDAPAGYLGNRVDFIGGWLRWSLRSNVVDWPPGSVLILIGGGLTLVADVEHPPAGAWTRYAVPLAAASFRLNNAAGQPATPAQFANAMSSLVAIRISAELGSEAGEETVDLDSVILRGPCLADLNGDGVVNAADLTILLGSWGPFFSAADLDDSRTVDAADLSILLGAWGPCP